MPEHVGRLSDAIDGAEPPMARLARIAKPTGKVYRNDGHQVGNGDPCPTEGHGKMYVLSSGRQWCPDQSHDKEKMVPHG